MMTAVEREGSIGQKMFNIVIWIAVPFWVLGVVKGLVFGGRLDVMLLDDISFLASIIALILWRNKRVSATLLINTYCCFWLVMFAFYWKHMGGIDGPFSYAFFTLMIFFVGVLAKKARLVLVTLLVSLNLILTLYGDQIPFLGTVRDNSNSINPIALDFVLNSALIALMVGYLKTNFDKGRKKIQERNIKLDQFNLELNIKRQSLIDQKEMIVKIQNNLEALIKDRTQQHEMINQELQDYAYDNTHIVRGPLTNILAIIDLVKQEELSDQTSAKDILQIEKHALELDRVIQKINVVLK